MNTFKNTPEGKEKIKKAYEIGYAALRLSGDPGTGLGNSLERSAFSFFGSVLRAEYEYALNHLDDLAHIIRLGADANLIRRENAEVVLRHATIFANGIREAAMTASASEAETGNEIENIFKNGIAEYETMSGIAEYADDSERRQHSAKELGHKTNITLTGADQEKRRDIIVQRVRENGNCRVKEIQEILPDTSERTIRYDLQKLLETGKIERIGNGGPATYYKFAETSL